MGWDVVACAGVAAVLGVLTAAGELVSTYKDEPGKALRTGPGVVYMGFNALIGVAAYLIVRAAAESPASELSALGELGWAVVGGLGGVALMRIKLFTVRFGDEQKSIGPGNLIDALLKHFDRQIDRQRALQRCQLVRETMEGIDVDKAMHFVNVQIGGSLQHLSPEDNEELGERSGEIAAAGLPMREKALALGFLILDFMGEDFLRDLFEGRRQEFLVKGQGQP